jgi:ubiquinone/menaquinone biosynthesis C-methylase UbiE
MNGKRRASKGESHAEWDRRWQRKEGVQFQWHATAPPSELSRLIDEAGLKGFALDLGCGDGSITCYLAEHFDFAVGVDIAFGAVSRGRGKAKASAIEPQFVAGDVIATPFAAEKFDFVFDRGCLQNIPQRIWPRYFREVNRLLRSGGHYQLFCSKPRLPSFVTPRGLRERTSWLLGRKGPRFTSPAVIEYAMSHSMKGLEFKKIPFRTATGHERIWTYGLWEKQ